MIALQPSGGGAIFGGKNPAKSTRQAMFGHLRPPLLPKGKPAGPSAWSTQCQNANEHSGSSVLSRWESRGFADSD